MANITPWKDEILAPAPGFSDTAPRYNLISPDGTPLAQNLKIILQNVVDQVGTEVNAENVNTLITDINALSDALTKITNGTTKVPKAVAADTASNANTVGGKQASDFLLIKPTTLVNTDLNTVNYACARGYAANCANKPTSYDGYLFCAPYKDSDGFAAQIAVPGESTSIYVRTAKNNTGTSWTNWRDVSSGGNAATVSGKAPADILRMGGKHLAGQGTSGGYSFLGDGGEDTGMFSNSDGDLYFLMNAVKHIPVTSQNIGSQSVSYATGAGNADTVDGFHIAGIGTSAPGSLANNTFYFVYE